MANERFLSRNLLLLIVAIIMGVILLGTVFSMLLKPTLTIHAPIGSTITITNVGDNSQVARRNATTSVNTTIGVRPGTYAIIVTYHTSKQLFHTTVGSFHKKSFQFSAGSELNALLVGRQVAFNAIPSRQSVTFLDTTKRIIANLNAHGDPTALDNSNPVGGLSYDNPGSAQAFHPIADGQAIVLTGDTLYVLRNGRLTPLHTDGLPKYKVSMAIGTNITQRSFVISANQTLYWYSSPEAKPQKVMDLPKAFDQVAYGGNIAIVYSTRMPSAVENIKAAYSAYAVDPIRVDLAAKTQTVVVNGPIVDASVSPNGRLATIEPQGSRLTSLYDMVTNSVLYTTGNPDITTPLWIDNTHYVYGKGSDVWNFDVSRRIATATGTLPYNFQPTSITYSSAEHSYLVTCYNDAAEAAIFRLSKATVDQNAINAAAVAGLPQSNNLFSLSYINVSQPTILIVTNTTLNTPKRDEFKSATLQSRVAGLEYLQSMGIDTAKLQVVYDPSSF